MFKKIAYKQKRLGLALLMVLMVYLSYIFSFKQTINAIATHMELSKAGKNENFSDSALPQIERKNSFYQEVLKGYRIRKQDSENQIWQSVSGMAVAEKVLISFDPDDKSLPADTGNFANNLVRKQFLLKGNYFNITRFLDTLSRARGIGRLSEVNLYMKKSQGQDHEAKDLNLAITLVGQSF
jgi:hypothetical protein